MIEAMKQGGVMQKLIDLAKQDTDEAWEKIDEILPGYCNEQDVFEWARANINNQNSALSDLAATILESTDIELSPEDIDDLLLLMRSDNPENPYPSFRAACALAKWAQSELVSDAVLQEVKEKLEAFIEDPDVSGIARSYIDNLSK